MTFRCLTEILDRNDDERTSFTVGTEAAYVEIVVHQWTVGEECEHPVRVLLDRDDAIALRDALTRCIEETNGGVA